MRERVRNGKAGRRCFTVGWSGYSQASPTRKFERSHLQTPRLHCTIAVATGSQLQVVKPWTPCVHALAIACTFSLWSGIDRILRGTLRSLVVRDAGSSYCRGRTFNEVSPKPRCFHCEICPRHLSRRKYCDTVIKLTIAFDKRSTPGHHIV